MAATIAWQEFQAIARGAQERASVLDGQALAQFHTAQATIAGRLSGDVPRVSGGTCDATIGPVLAQQDIVSLVTIDVDGQMVCRAGETPPELPRPWRWYEQVRGGASVSLDASGPERVPVLAVHGAGGDVVAAVLPSTWFAIRTLPNPTAPGDATWLLDADRTVLASRGDAAPALPSLATMVHLIGANQMAMRAASAQGYRYAYATTLLPGGWRLIGATAAEAEHALAVRSLLYRMAELALLLALGLAAVVLGADVAFGNPLRRLSTAVRRWQQGSPFEPGNLAGAPDEVLELAQSFREATSVLRQKEAELVWSQEKQNLLVLEIHHRVKNNLQVIAS